ncbi:MAG: hypothetical protein ACKOPS_16435, partial [Cyanobium sp.]
TFVDSYNSDTSKFNTPSNGGVMPWWGNDALAAQFAIAVQLGLGTPNNDNLDGGFFDISPYFARSVNSTQVFVTGWASQIDFLVTVDISRATPRTYAQATLVTPSSSAVPGPLPIFGAATAFGMSRRLRRRISTQPYKV